MTAVLFTISTCARAKKGPRLSTTTGSNLHLNLERGRWLPIVGYVISDVLVEILYIISLSLSRNSRHEMSMGGSAANNNVRRCSHITPSTFILDCLGHFQAYRNLSSRSCFDVQRFFNYRKTRDDHTDQKKRMNDQQRKTDRKSYV